MVELIIKTKCLQDILSDIFLQEEIDDSLIVHFIAEIDPFYQLSSYFQKQFQKHLGKHLDGIHYLICLRFYTSSESGLMEVISPPLEFYHLILNTLIILQFERDDMERVT